MMSYVQIASPVFQSSLHHPVLFIFLFVEVGAFVWCEHQSVSLGTKHANFSTDLGLFPTCTFSQAPTASWWEAFGQAAPLISE